MNKDLIKITIDGYKGKIITFTASPDATVEIVKVADYDDVISIVGIRILDDDIKESIEDKSNFSWWEIGF